MYILSPHGIDLTLSLDCISCNDPDTVSCAIITCPRLGVWTSEKNYYDYYYNTVLLYFVYLYACINYAC